MEFCLVRCVVQGDLTRVRVCNDTSRFITALSGAVWMGRVKLFRLSEFRKGDAYEVEITDYHKG
jgi:hypothetical protein